MVLALAVIVVAAPEFTVFGKVPVGAIIDPPVPADTVSWYVFSEKFAVTVALPEVRVTDADVADVALVMVPAVLGDIVQLTNL